MTQNSTIFIDKLTFRDSLQAEPLSCAPNDIIIFVGANNCGKTTALNEIFEPSVQDTKRKQNHIISEVSHTINGNGNDFERFIIENGKQNPSHPSNYRMNGHEINLDQSKNFYEQRHPILMQASGKIFCTLT